MQKEALNSIFHIGTEMDAQQSGTGACDGQPPLVLAFPSHIITKVGSIVAGQVH